MKEVEFRDGRRLVQDHVADHMPDNAYTLTYEEAMVFVNQNFLRRRLDKAQDDVIRQHFARYPKS